MLTFSKSKRAFRTKQKMFACNQNEKINWAETHLILSFCKGEHRASCAAEIQKRHKHKKTNGYSLFSVYFLFSVFTVKPPTQKTQNKPKTSPQYDCSPDRVSTAIRCHKATGSQCASVAGTSLGTNKYQQETWDVWSFNDVYSYYCCTKKKKTEASCYRKTAASLKQFYR